MKQFLILLLICIKANLIAQLPFSLIPVEYASGIEKATEITHAGDNRLFVCQQNGIIKIIDSNGQVLPTPFLNLESKVNSRFEQGLLSLAFHPDYTQNGLFYVFYTDLERMNRVVQFSVSADDPNRADPNSEKLIFSHETIVDYHHGGCLRFGPDGFLYISIGDAGFADKVQDVNSYLGKILRIDIDNGDPYAIPNDNPYINVQNAKGELWVMGLRNPWKFSFDAKNGDVWIADVGYKDYEEINHITGGTNGGINFGFPCFEGQVQSDFFNCDDVTDELIFPDSGYPNDIKLPSCGASITGGYVYRGNEERLEDLNLFISGDYCTGKIDATLFDDVSYQIVNLHDRDYTIDNISTFGEDYLGELYAADYESGKIFHLDFSCYLPSVEITVASCDDANDACIEITIPDNENIEEVIIRREDGSLVDEDDYCNLSAGVYTMTSINQDPDCTREILFVVNSFSPIVNTTLASCSVANDACVDIEVRQNTRDYFEFHVESEDGQIIDSSDYCNLEKGTYFIVVDLVEANCQAEYEFNIYHRNSGFPSIFENDTLFVIDTFINYQWHHSDTIAILGEVIDGATDYFHTPNKTGYYKVLATEQDGCMQRSYAKLVTITAIENNAFLSSFSLTPNPAYDFLLVDIKFDTPKSISYAILDVKGTTVYSVDENVKITELNKNISLEYFSSGLYYFRVTDGINTIIKEFVKI